MDEKILKEYRRLRILSRPSMLIILSIMLFSIMAYSIIRSIIKGASVSDLLGLFILFLLSLLGYFSETKSKIILFNNRIIIRKFLFGDKDILISDLESVEKKLISVIRMQRKLKFYLKNGQCFTAWMIEDYYDLIDNLKKINPEIKVK